MVESFVVLNAVGGERVDDFQHFRDDVGLKEMLGHEVPSPESARQFLNRFHSEEKLEQARDGRKPEQIAFIPEDADAPAGLGEVNRELVRELGSHCPEQRIATVDQDATIIEATSGRRSAPMKASAAISRCWREFTESAARTCAGCTLFECYCAAIVLPTLGTTKLIELQD